MKTRIDLLFLLLSIYLLCMACGQSEENASHIRSVIEKKRSPEQSRTVRIKHLAGEVLAVNSKGKTITVRVRDENIELQFDDRTIVKIDHDGVKPYSIPLGIRATVKYVERNGQYVARGIFISTETAEKKESPPHSFFQSSA